MSKLSNDLAAFAARSKMTNRGAICVALVVTRHAKQTGLPLDPAKLVTHSGGQVLGLGKTSVQRILKDHGITRTLAEEGARTSRGSIGNMQAYVAFLNSLKISSPSVLEEVEAWWIGRVKKFFEGKPLVFRMNSGTSLRSVLRDILKQATVRQKEGAGTMFLGAVMQHLVGAKLELVLGREVETHGAFVADAVTDRPGDYLVEDVVIHVTTSPGEALLRKCSDNLDQGLRPLIITTFKNVPVAETMADNAGLVDRVEIFDIEQFVASNILELSKFTVSGRKLTVQELIVRYNRIAACENDPGLLISQVGR